MCTQAAPCPTVPTAMGTAGGCTSWKRGRCGAQAAAAAAITTQRTRRPTGALPHAVRRERATSCRSLTSQSRGREPTPTAGAGTTTTATIRPPAASRPHSQRLALAAAAVGVAPEVSSRRGIRRGADRGGDHQSMCSQSQCMQAGGPPQPPRVGGEVWCSGMALPLERLKSVGAAIDLILEVRYIGCARRQRQTRRPRNMVSVGALERDGESKYGTPFLHLSLYIL